MRGINGGIKRLIKLLTMKYYYHCFINKPKVPILHTYIPPTFGRSSPTCTYCQENGQKRKKKQKKKNLMANLQEATLWLS